MTSYVVAVDVGTASARAGVFDASGDMLGRAEHELVMDSGEYDSEQIWRAVCHCVRTAMMACGAMPESIAGISFDATCSLVLRGRDGEPLPLREADGHRFDTIAWFDHRAVAEAERCTATGHEVLDFVGGVMSPEMEVPKLMWLKRHRPDIWQAMGAAYDLCDFLTWRASGANDRSVCALACKWTYLGHTDDPWRADFFESVGVADVLQRTGLPALATNVGARIGPLTAQAADELGLTTNCTVVCGLIDAHAGAVGTIGAMPRDSFDSHLALIAGTSTCVMALAPEAREIAGVWGPYRDAVLPGLWLNEGGQSATGSLLDYVLERHGLTLADHARMTELAEAEIAKDPDFAARLHVVPDHHGNRSPLADPNALGVVSGLTLDTSDTALAALYYKTALGIAYGVRHIVESMNAAGYRIDTLHVAGGHTKNSLLMRLYADATQCQVVAAGAEDGVLLGTAVVAAGGCGLHPDVYAAARAMVPAGTSAAFDPAQASRHATGYRRFRLMQDHRAALDAM